MNVEYSDIKSKDVINVCNGRKLGRTIDLVIDTVVGKVRGIVVPGEKGLNFFKSSDDLYIPWKNIKRIGSDVILVEVGDDVRVEALASAKTAEESGGEED